MRAPLLRWQQGSAQGAEAPSAGPDARATLSKAAIGHVPIDSVGAASTAAGYVDTTFLSLNTLLGLACERWWALLGY
jgi:hypothetical protein